jgi:endonuclease/exonuclease/phosphatase family metal-dependent hydrolase
MKSKNLIPLSRLLAFGAILLAVCLVNWNGKRPANQLRVLYWNIQNGMWSGQGDNYDSFVDWVKQQKPDICIWAEAQTIYKTDTADGMDAEARYLVDNWGELAARYGHKYWYVGGHRDNYPQVITSKYPIENVERIVGAEPDSVVTHGSGWARIVVKGQTLNLVTLHTWPQVWAFRAKDQAASRAAHEGDNYRRMELEYICSHTIGTVPDAGEQLWLMAGDFNSRSRLDNGFYKYPEDDTRLLAQDYILQHTPYVDVIAEKYPSEFKTTTGGKARIDYVYCSRPLYDRITWADVIIDDYTKPVRDEKGLSNFYHPSDHLPIMVDIDIRRRR